MHICRELNVNGYFLITRWQQLLINRIVGYDTILMNSLLTSTGQGDIPLQIHLLNFVFCTYCKSFFILTLWVIVLYPRVI